MNRIRIGARQLLVICLAGAFLFLFYYGRTHSNNSFLVAVQVLNQKLELLNSTIKAQVPRIKVFGLDPHNSEKVLLPQYSKASSCRIPKLSLNNVEVSKFFSQKNFLNCSGEPLWLEVDANNKLVLTKYAQNIGIKTANLECSLFFYERVTDIILKWTRVHNFEVGSTVDESENFLANCTHKNRTWKHLYMNFVPNVEVIKNASETQHTDDWSKLNVLFMGFDSLSQQAFRRNLPLTTIYLEKDMEAVVLNGYNIVGDGTPQAYIPILTAKTEEELPLTRKRYRNAQFVDVYPWIWRDFKKSGYITGYGEDAAAIGTFTYRLKGFKNQPTDHYTRTFFQFAEKYERNWRCSGPLPQHQVWFKYADDFMRKYPKDLPKFLLMHHSLLSHDDTNLVKNADADFRNLLKGLHKDGLLNNTMVIVMADHGHRFSKLRATQQGQLEERLPFFSVYLPQDFRKTVRGNLMYKNLKINADRLATPFDVHATLLNILRLPSVKELSHPQTAKNRSLSLFQEIPQTRTCEQAAILPHWCTCLTWKSTFDTDKGREISNMLANAVVQAINSYTSSERSLCAELRLAEVFESKWLVPDTTLLKYSGVKDQDGFVPDLNNSAQITFGTYQIRFRTLPGNALYDVTVYYDSAMNEIKVDFKSLSHINKFGDTPHCIIDKNYFMATYCVCYDKIEA